MKDKILSLIALLLLASSILTGVHGAGRQTEKKPRQEYMTKLLSRDTKPLGLRENKTLRKLLDQPHIKWVIRSEHKHVLN